MSRQVSSYPHRLTRRYLAAAAQMETLREQSLRGFSAAVNDDDEVRGLFEKHARESSRQAGLVLSRLREYGGEAESDFPSQQSSTSGFSSAAPSFQPSASTEERLVHDLMSSYSAEMGLCGVYELLRGASELEADTATASLAVQLQAEHRDSAQEFFHMLPSRSKIAFNMLTVSEVDPSVETKVGDDRLVGR